MEELIEELINDISQKTLEELKKANKLPYPLYYKEVFNGIVSDKGILNQLNPKLLCIESDVNENLINFTKATIEEVKQKSNVIKNSSKDIIEDIDVFEPEDLKANIIKFSAFLIQNIDEMENKIKELESELDKAYKELLIDPLTKVYNRKALERDLLEILEKGNDRDLNLCIAILDLDNFKSINDTYGHLVGDFVLIKFAQIMKSLIRSSDKIYRYGGDEFVIVFNRSTLINAKKSIERIINKISKIKLKYKDYIITLTVSAGIAYHKKGDDIKSILQRADDALYEAKATKNSVKVK